MLRFPMSLKEADTLFILGNYMEMVDKSMRASYGKLFVGSVRGQLVAKLAIVGSRATQTLNNTVIQSHFEFIFFFNACCSVSSFSSKSTLVL